MMFKNFEIRRTKSLDGMVDPKRFEVVKWYDHNPVLVTDCRTGEQKMSSRSCYVVAWLTWDAKEHGFDLESVGLRLVEDWIDGFDQFIVKWCEMASVCMWEDE